MTMRNRSLAIVVPVSLIFSQPVAAHVALEPDTLGIANLLGLVLMLVAASAYGSGLIRMWRRAGVGRGIRQWQGGCFYLGITALVAALFWPLEALSRSNLWLHMVQHMVLIAVAAPLLALGRPWIPVLLSFPQPSQARILRWWRSLDLPRWLVLPGPLAATAIHGVVIWFWHAPGPFNLALANEAIHIIEHVTLFGTALLFWWALLKAGSQADGFGSGAMAALATLMHMGVLGALLTFAPTPLYERFASFSLSTLSPLEDQQLAGLIMWIPTSAVYLAAGLALIARGLENARRQASSIHSSAI
ncbi:MAG: cytochrome c oxidase assembly protein [Nitrosospira sp.]|nr:cytochrome c oxidase assembly protein [Nitrosospira sp.]